MGDPCALAPIPVGKFNREELHALFSRWQYETDEGIQIATIEPSGSPDASTRVIPLDRQMSMPPRAATA